MSKFNEGQSSSSVLSIIRFVKQHACLDLLKYSRIDLHMHSLKSEILQIIAINFNNDLYYILWNAAHCHLIPYNTKQYRDKIPINAIDFPQETTQYRILSCKISCDCGQYRISLYNTMLLHSITSCNIIQYRTISDNTVQYLYIPNDIIQYCTWSYNTVQYLSIPNDIMQYRTISYNTVQYRKIP